MSFSDNIISPINEPPIFNCVIFHCIECHKPIFIDLLDRSQCGTKYCRLCKYIFMTKNKTDEEKKSKIKNK